jgi:Circularly permutated YpsA SLOG family
MSWKVIIISGGQTGADRAGLDFAIKHNIPHGGWCPKGRKALDGPLDEKYKLKETPSDDYPERTEWNARDSDATVVFTLAEKPSGGSKKTITLAKKHKKPCLHLHRGILAVPDKLVAFLDKHHPVRKLNIAGSRESKEPGLYDWVMNVLERTKVSLEEREKTRALKAGHDAGSIHD